MWFGKNNKADEINLKDVKLLKEELLAAQEKIAFLEEMQQSKEELSKKLRDEKNAEEKSYRESQIKNELEVYLKYKNLPEEEFVQLREKVNSSIRFKTHKALQEAELRYGVKLMHLEEKLFVSHEESNLEVHSVENNLHTKKDEVDINSQNQGANSTDLNQQEENESWAFFQRF